MLWILDRPDCDLSTGLEIFWLGEGYSQLDPNSSLFGKDMDSAVVGRKAIERMARLTGGRFRFRPPDYAREWIDKGINWDEATRREIEPFMCEIEGDERYPVYSEGVPAQARIAYFEAIGEAVPDWLRDDAAAELAGENLNETEAEMQQRFRAARKDDLRDWIEVFAEVERLKKGPS